MSLPDTPEWDNIREIVQILTRILGPPAKRPFYLEDTPEEVAYYERIRAEVALLPPDPEFDAAFAAEQARRMEWIRTEVAAELAQESAILIESTRVRTKPGGTQ
jgi:hypothetical protein